MAIPPGSLQTSFDFQNPSCFTNGGTAITDLSGNGNNFTLNNTSYTYDATYGSVLFPSSTYADGTPSDYAFGTAAFSVLAWVKFNTSVPGINVFHFGASGTGERTAFLWRSSDNLIVVDNAGSAGAWDQTADNEWHLLAITRPSSSLCNQQKVYLDGVLIPFSSSAFNPTAPLNATLGAARIHDTSFGSGDLEIATFDVYTADLSAGDILAYYNDTASRFVPPPAVISEIDFINPACFTNGGTAVTDLSGNNNDWALQNTSYTYNATVGTLDLPTGNALIDATTGYYSGNVPFSVSFWFYYESTMGETRCFYNGGYPSAGWVEIHTLPGSGDVMRFIVNGSYLDSSASLVDGQHNYITATYDGTTFNGYINNVLEVTTTGPINQSTSNNMEFNLSAYNPNGLEGLGLIYFYDGAINSTVRTQLYNDGLTRFAPAPPPSSNGVGGRQFAQGFNG